METNESKLNISVLLTYTRPLSNEQTNLPTYPHLVIKGDIINTLKKLQPHCHVHPRRNDLTNLLK